MKWFSRKLLQNEPKPIIELVVMRQEEAIKLTAADLTTAYVGKIWEVYSPIHFEGIGLIGAKVRCTAPQEFTLTKQMQYSAEEAPALETLTYKWDAKHQNLYPKNIEAKYMEGVAEYQSYQLLDALNLPAESDVLDLNLALKPREKSL